MKSRLPVVCVVLWALFAVVATATDHFDKPAAGAGSRVVLAAQDQGIGNQGTGKRAGKPFKHSEHVNRAWQNLAIDEVYRDCRGCHRFTPEDGYSAPQAECDSCHQGAGKLEPKFDEGWQEDLSAHATRTSPAFRHYTHGMLECRQCHYDEVGLFSHFPIRTGPAFCAECHEQTVTAADVGKLKWLRGVEDEQLAKAVGLQAAFVAPADPAAYAKQLDLVFAGPNGGVNTISLPTGGAFDHADHIDTVVGAEQGLACTVCHVNIQTASAREVGTDQIPVDGCKTCHISDANLTPAVAAKSADKADLQPLWSLGAFAHGDHFGFLEPGGSRRANISNDQGYQEIEGKECAACHAYAPEVAGLSDRDFPFDGEASRHTYSDCVQCHELEGWQTGEQEGSSDNPPLHTSNGGTGWQDCADCHELGKPDMAGLRPKESVQRWTGRTFAFEGQTHPHITSSGVRQSTEKGDEVLQQDCATCHRAVVPALPTRLFNKAFTHKTHLPPDATAKDCAGCHESAQTAANSLALAGSDFRTYSLKSCSTCHWGSEVVEQVEREAKPAERAVVAFPHALHVNAGQSCSECHVMDAQGSDIITKSEALSCKQCHKHEAIDGARPPERLIATEVASCVRCHHEDIAGEQVASVPPPQGSPMSVDDPRYQAEQVVFAGFAQSQFHPAGTNCADCHMRKDKRGKFSPLVVPTGRSHMAASRNRSVHANVSVGGFGKDKPTDCLRCHWKTVGKWPDAIRIAADEPPGFKAFRVQPGSKKTRAKFGNLFRGYPGRIEGGR